MDNNLEKCEPVAEVRLSVTGRKELFLPSFNAIFANFGTGVGQGFEVGTKLYTSPISKEWVDLSDERLVEITKAWSVDMERTPKKLAMAINDELKYLNAEKG